MNGVSTQHIQWENNSMWLFMFTLIWITLIWIAWETSYGRYYWTIDKCNIHNLKITSTTYTNCNTTFVVFENWLLYLLKNIDLMLIWKKQEAQKGLYTLIIRNIKKKFWMLHPWVKSMSKISSTTLSMRQTITSKTPWMFWKIFSEK